MHVQFVTRELLVTTHLHRLVDFPQSHVVISLLGVAAAGCPYTTPPSCFAACSRLPKEDF